MPNMNTLSKKRKRICVIRCNTRVVTLWGGKVREFNFSQGNLEKNEKSQEILKIFQNFFFIINGLLKSTISYKL